MMNDRLAKFGVVAIGIILVWGIIELGTPRFPAETELKKLEDRIPELVRAAGASEKLKGVRFHVTPKGGGAIYVLGDTKSQSELQNLKRRLEQAHPDMKFIWTIRVLSPENFDLIDTDGQ